MFREGQIVSFHPPHKTASALFINKKYSLKKILQAFSRALNQLCYKAVSNCICRCNYNQVLLSLIGHLLYLNNISLVNKY